MGILGCTGLVGQQFVKILDNHPYFHVSFLSASEKSAGKTYREAADWIIGSSIPADIREMRIAELTPSALKERGVKFLFSALPSEAARQTERRLAEEGFFVFSNASAFRMDAAVPIVIPEVNPEHFALAEAQALNGRGFIITNSNCSASGLALGLRPLSPFGLKSVMVTTCQALSGAGRRGVASLDILGNVIPHIKDEEEKIEKETKKIFGQVHSGVVEEASFEVNASCCRVPTRVGHLESIVIETEKELEVNQAVEAWESFQGIPQKMQLPTSPRKPIIAVDKTSRPQPILDAWTGSPDRARGMAVSIGKVRKKGGKINFFLLVNNMIRGAAGTCLLNAEYAVKKWHIE